MSNIESIGGPDRITPHDRQMYEQEYKQGAQLFQNAMQQYVKSDNPYQKKAFQEVMDKSLEILNETARGLNRKSLLEQNAKIEKDYDSFNHAPDDAKVVSQLDKDLEQAKRSV